MARRRYQQGTVALEKRKDGKQIWVGRFWVDLPQTNGSFKRTRKKIVLGTKPEMTKPLAKKALSPYLDGVNGTLATARSSQSLNPQSLHSFQSVAEKWCEQILSYSKVGTQQVRRCYLNVWILPTFGEYSIADISREMLQSWLKNLEKKLAPPSIRGIKDTLSMIFAMAVEYGYLDKNRAAGLRVPKYDRDRDKKALEVKQVQALLQNLTGVYHTAVYFLAETGLRAGELAGLRIQDFDTTTQTVSVKQQYRPSSGVGTPKTKSSKRTICISGKLAKMLVELIGNRKEGMVFVYSGRGHFSCTRMLPHVRKQWKALGLDPTQYNVHSFRHFNASLMSSLRIPLRVMKERLGHSMSQDITLGTYVHVYEKDAKEAAETIARAIGGEPTPDPDETREKSVFLQELSKLMQLHGISSHALSGIVAP